MGKRGKKTCPKCNAELGAPTVLCKCGYNFYPDKVKKEKEVIPLQKGRGVKECPECQLLCGNCVQMCKCGFDYSTIVRKKKEAPTKKGPGVKECPECKSLFGVRIQICTCGFDFSTIVKPEKKSKEQKVEKGEKLTPAYIEMQRSIAEHVTPKKLSPKEHAERILSYGIERAKLLLQFAKINRSWAHVDWVVVEAGLSL